MAEQHDPAATDEAVEAPTEEPEGDAAASPDELALPQRFDGGFRLGRIVGGATLVVDQDGLRLFPDSSLQAHDGAEPLRQTRGPVGVFSARWQPPTANTGVLVADDHSDRVALVDLPGWQRERLRAAFAASDLELEERSTTWQVGTEHVHPSASPWPRWLQRRLATRRQSTTATAPDADAAKHAPPD